MATALVDTGSRMDDLIFEEFNGTGNLEIQLDLTLVDKRVFPAIDIQKSGTRKEEVLLDQADLKARLGAPQGPHPPVSGRRMELLLDQMAKTASNAVFLTSMQNME